MLDLRLFEGICLASRIGSKLELEADRHNSTIGPEDSQKVDGKSALRTKGNIS